jgi:hypothetical protein
MNNTVPCNPMIIVTGNMIPHVPIEETIRACVETARTIISAVCAERFDPTPSYQTCRFCDYADLCGMKEAGGK